MGSKASVFSVHLQACPSYVNVLKRCGSGNLVEATMEREFTIVAEVDNRHDPPERVHPNSRCGYRRSSVQSTAQIDLGLCVLASVGPGRCGRRLCG